jgi:hypothetical protein
LKAKADAQKWDAAPDCIEERGAEITFVECPNKSGVVADSRKNDSVRDLQI